MRELDDASMWIFVDPSLPLNVPGDMGRNGIPETDMFGSKKIRPGPQTLDD